MPLDPRLSLAVQQPDIAGAQERGMSMKQLALKGDQMQKEAGHNDQLRTFDMIARLTAGVKDQDTYDRALGEASSMGMDVSKLPRAYDPGLVNSLRARSVSYLDQLKANQDQEMMGLRKREVLAQEKAAGIKAEQDRASGKNLPMDQQTMVHDMAKKNAAKKSIKNQLEAFSKKWDSLSEDQKIVQGRQLLKTLNSPEGADAIGAEEAKRLGGLLEYKIFNLTQPGSMFGRDVEEFKTQVDNTSSILDQGIKSNQSEIDSMMGRKTVVKTQTNQKTGAKRIVYSDGTFEEIPAQKVAGGK